MSYCIVKRSRPKFITYQYQEKLVFVAPASDYEQALDIAQKEFPKLAKVPRERITLNVFVLHQESNSRRSIRISPDAWSATIDSASPGQIVDIEVLPSSKKFWSFRTTGPESGESSQQGKEVDATSSSSGKSWLDEGDSHTKSGQ